MAVLTGNHSVLQVHPTRHCNLTCLHCYSLSGPTVIDSLPVTVLRSAVAGAADLGYGVLSLSGGEPSLYPDLVELLAHAKAAGMRTTVTSNGLPLSTRLLGAVAPVLDVLALSLDGVPATHNRMRNHPRAFELLERRTPAIRASGIPFGFITTLTRHNVHELAWVLDFAESNGGAFVQVHPLEATGGGAINLSDSIPDEREDLFALFETARLAATGRIPIQVDITTRPDLTNYADQFNLNHIDPASRGRLGDWLSPLVIQTDGTVVPLTYGMPSHLSLGDLHDSSLASLAAHWNPGLFFRTCQVTARRLIQDGGSVFDWYAEVLNTARGDLELVRTPTDMISRALFNKTRT